MAQRSKAGHPILGAVGLALLAVPGFALGVVAGVAWEDPSLLIAHLLGRSVEAPWGSVAGARPEPLAADAGRAPQPAQPAPARGVEQKLPDVAAPAPKPAAVVAKPAPAATRLRPEVLSPGGSERFAVQVGAFAESRSAEGLVEQLRGKGFRAYVSPSAKAGAARWRVRVGPLPTREKAEGVAARLKAEEKLPTWVLDENAV